MLFSKELKFLELILTLADFHLHFSEMIVIKVIKKIFDLLYSIFDFPKDSSEAHVEDECAHNQKAEDKVYQSRKENGLI